MFSRLSAADPGFPVGRGAPTRWEGRRLLTQALFSGDLCENNWHALAATSGSATGYHTNTLVNQYSQTDGVHPKITHFKQTFGCTFCLITVNFQLLKHYE